MHPKEKQHLIQTLAERLCRSQGSSLIQYSELTVRHTDYITNVHLGETEVYKRQRDHQQESKAVNREMFQFGVGLRGTAHYFTVSVWEDDHANRTIELLKAALVLDLLAAEAEDPDE